LSESAYDAFVDALFKHPVDNGPVRWFAAKVLTSGSPERRTPKRSKPEYLHVRQTLKKMSYSSIPFGRRETFDGTAEPGKRFDRVLSVVVVPGSLGSISFGVREADDSKTQLPQQRA
jgi:hypothetical protein